jgi:hypothetical protein
MKCRLALVTTTLLATSAAADPPATCECSAERAGYAQNIAWWARPSDTGRYVGSYVGGGNPWYRRADPPSPSEGTWGWDYWGGCFKRNVILGWWHDRRYQGGVGAYRTEGPHILPRLEP